MPFWRHWRDENMGRFMNDTGRRIGYMGMLDGLTGQVLFLSALRGRAVGAA